MNRKLVLFLSLAITITSVLCFQDESLLSSAQNPFLDASDSDSESDDWSFFQEEFFDEDYSNERNLAGLRGARSSNKRRTRQNAYRAPRKTSKVNNTWVTSYIQDTADMYLYSYSGRFQMNINTDKPIYKEEEVMFIEGFIVDAFNKTPVGLEDLDEYYDVYYFTLEIKDSSDTVIYTDYSQSQDSTVSFTYQVPASQNGGEYYIVMSAYSIPTTIKKVRIEDYPQNSLLVYSDLDQGSYYPGDLVLGKISVSTMDGSPFTENPTYSYSVQFEETTVEQDSVELSNIGQGFFSIPIPSSTKVTLATIAFVAEYGSIKQVYSKLLIIGNPDDLTIDFFPDTGQFVSGVPNNIYFQAYTSPERSDVATFYNGQLVEIKSNDRGRVLAKNIQTYHEGKGNFTMFPKANTKYSFEVYLGSSPKKISVPMYVYGVEDNEILFTIDNKNKVLDFGDDLRLTFFGNELFNPSGIYMITVSLKEQIVYSDQVRLSKKSTLVIKNEDIIQNNDNGGIYQVNLHKLSSDIIIYSMYLRSTRYENAPEAGNYYGYSYKDEEAQIPEIKPEKARLRPSSSNTRSRKASVMPDVIDWQIPKGECLFFIKPKEVLKVEITTDSDVYAPGSQVNFEVKVLNQAGLLNVALPSYISVFVTDESIFYKLEPKDQPASFAAGLYLQYDLLNSDTQVPHINDYVDQFFDNNSTQGEANNFNLELVLSVQGWRACIFCLPYIMEISDTLYDANDTYSSQIQNLFGYYYESYDYLFGVEDMVFDEMAFDDMGVGALPMPMARGAFAPTAVAANAATAIEAPVAKTTSNSQDNDVSSSTSTAFNETAPKNFMNNIETNTRYWSHPLRQNYISGQRIDMTATQFYQSADKVTEGVYKGSFYLSDLITQFRITANVFDTIGRIGQSQEVLQSAAPFYINFELPPSMCVTDELEIPIYVNNLLKYSASVTLTIQLSESLSYSISSSQVNVDASSNSVVNIKVSGKSINQTAYLYVSAAATVNSQQYQDSLVKYTKVVAKGFPQSSSSGGFIGSAADKSSDVSSSVAFSFDVPKTIEAGTLNFTAMIFSNNYDSLLEAVNTLIRSPYGCFEQASATTYPMVMALSFLEGQDDQNEEIIAMKIKSQSKVQEGYQLLTTYQTNQDKGFEWFGSDPANEALTAYGLLEFTDMKKVTNFVSSDVITRASNWLLSRKDGKGGFKKSTLAIDSFGRAPDDTTDAYIVWALTSAGYTDDVTVEINKLMATADQYLKNDNIDPYFFSLLAASLYNLDLNTQAKKYAQIVTRYQLSSGNVTNSIEYTSITNSQGSYLEIETTAIAAIAWLNDQDTFSSNIKNAIEWLVSQVELGAYGSTQGTILSLKALTTYMENFSQLNGDGIFALSVNGKEIQSIFFTPEKKDKIQFDLSPYIKANENTVFAPGSTVNFEMSLKQYSPKGDTSDFSSSYSFNMKYYDVNPPSSKGVLDFAVTPLFATSTLGEESSYGNEFRYSLKVTNTDDETGLGMTVIIFRIPSCLSINYNFLSQLKSSGEVDYYEVTGDSTQVVLYWRNFAPSQSKTVTVGFVQGFNGQCYQQPHNAYVYYDPESPIWFPMPRLD